MSPISKNSDAAIVPALIILAVILFAGAYVAGELIIFRVLRQDAEDVVRSWQTLAEERVGPDLKLRPAGASAPDSMLAVTAATAGGDKHLTEVRSAHILDGRGRRADGPSAHMRPPFNFSSPRDHYMFERAMRSGDVEYLLLTSQQGKDTHSVFYIPLEKAGSVIGAVRLELDQSSSAALLRDAFRAVIVLTVTVAMGGLLAAVYVLWQRIKDRWRAEEEIRFMALHDTLTHLPNRLQFNTQLSRALADARSAGTMVAVICIDVDNFKDINDTLGHPIGDAVLCSVAQRILASSGPAATVARLSGDEFAILIEEVRDREQVATAARRYLRSGALPHEIEGHELPATLSLGAAVAPGDGDDAETLLKHADLALYRAKAEGRNTYCFFTCDMDEELRRRRLIEQELRKELGGEQFALHYQPQFDLSRSQLTGFEALARWQHPELGSVSPATFVAVAEECGLIGPLGQWVVHEACRTAAGWERPVTVAVNLSAAQFRYCDVPDTVARALRDSGLPADRLEVEITESLLLNSSQTVLRDLNRLRNLGVGLALDDFGTGYSSLSYLTQFPFDKIKIDRSFVQRITTEKNTAAVVQAIVALGRALDVAILAEGVETQEQAAALRRVGCHNVQGFLFGRPAPQAHFPEAEEPEILHLQARLEQAIA